MDLVSVGLVKLRVCFPRQQNFRSDDYPCFLYRFGKTHLDNRALIKEALTLCMSYGTLTVTCLLMKGLQIKFVIEASLLPREGPR